MEKRQYLRHPSNIPIEILIEDVAASEREFLDNISFGGLCFKSRIFIETGKMINIKIPLLRPVFAAKGRVAWCCKKEGHFEVGVKFTEVCDAFKIRMAEQICRIEEYKKEIREKEGRLLDGTDAALEWIRKYAKDFPSGN
jgi:hypothetical protein